MEEWNTWLIDGLNQAPAYRAAALQCGGLSAKMDMMLCCIELMAQDAGQREKQLESHMIVIEGEQSPEVKGDAKKLGDIKQKEAEDQKLKKKTLLRPPNDAPDFTSWE